MSIKVANLTGYITDCDGGEGFAADSERMRNISLIQRSLVKIRK